MTCCAMDVLSMIRHSLVADGVNPITKYYQLGKHVASAGPEMLWKIYDAIRIIDKQEASVFIFEKRIADKLHKPRRREMVCEILRKEVEELDRFKHPRILQVWHKIEECHDSLAFATEPVRGSLANFLGNYERMPANVPSEIKDYTLLDIELKFGVLQIAESLAYLHMTELMLHRNICPESIIINRRGMWKVTGLGFSEKLRDGQEKFQSMPWSAKLPKMAQPDLDFIAPEVQIGGKPCSFSCDMFALGMVICAIYNSGRSLIQASHNPALYTKKIDQITELFDEVAHKMPLPLVEPVEKMINRDVRYRPSAQSFVQMKYFSEDAVIKCLQYLHFIESKDLSLKCELYTLLTQTIPYFPKKILYQFVFPYLRDELNTADMLVLVLPALVSLINHASNEEYCTIIKPVFGKVFSMTRPVQATVYLLEHIDLILSKTSDEEIKQDVLPMIFNTLESNSIQGQEAALNTFSIIRDHLNDQTMKKLVLPKAKGLYHKSMDVRVRVNALTCIDRLLDSLDKMIILDEVIPFLTEIQCGDVDIIMAVIAIYKHLLSDRKFGLTHNLLATKVMPTLIPHTVSPGLTMEQFSTLMEVLREMLDQIDRQRRNKMMMETADLVCTPEAMSKPSLNMRHNIHDGTRYERKMSAYEILCNKNLLSVEDAFKARTAPSTPEMLARTSQYANEMMCSRLTRRHSSVGPCQGLLANMGQEGDAIVEKFVRERRSSLVPGASLNNPMILVSEPSLPNLEESLLQPVPRRASTQSVGPIVIPVSDSSNLQDAASDVGSGGHDVGGTSDVTGHDVRTSALLFSMGRRHGRGSDCPNGHARQLL